MTDRIGGLVSEVTSIIEVTRNSLLAALSIHDFDRPGALTMRSYAIFTAIVMSTMLVVQGCSSGEQKYAPAQKVKEATSLDRVREWLTFFSKTGQTDSGVSLIREELGKVSVPGVDTAALQAEFDAATNNSNPATRKKLAEELLKKLPN